MSKLNQAMAHAEQYCKARGARLTPKRRLLFAELLASNKALSAYELIERCKQEQGQLLPATSVYRILDFLQSMHLVHRLNLANKYVACSQSCSHSGDNAVTQFLICSQCQKVEEIAVDKETVSQLQQNIQEAGFSLLAPQLEVNCICDDCRKKVA